jgi:7,8-dihydropterin-6-yl-methyl-4-(beta-D-ribofuranosyl)aminobenzene 5'-phosphate synthase
VDDPAKLHLSLTVLVENSAPDELVQEHGVSFWIETPEGNILLDAGQGPAIQENSRRLDVDLGRAHALVLSHGHYDHGNGLGTVLPQTHNSVLYLHPGALFPRYSLSPPEKHRFVGLSPTVQCRIAANASRIVWTPGPTRISPHIHLTGAIPRQTRYEDPGGPFFHDSDGRIPDTLPDDQALWIETSQGLIVLTGCAHSGVVNTLQTIQRLGNGRKILAVIGGFHLLHATKQRLQATVEALRCISAQILAPCHCTGQAALDTLAREFPAAVQPCQAGTKMRFEW